MGDNAYGRLVELKKKELTAALGKSTEKERDEQRAKIDLMDTNLVGDDREIDLTAGKDGDEGTEKYLFQTKIDTQYVCVHADACMQICIYMCIYVTSFHFKM